MMLFRQVMSSNQENKAPENLTNEEKLLMRMDVIAKKIDVLVATLESVQKGTSKMESHIQFIDGIYMKVQKPLFWICDKVNHMRSYSPLDSQKSLVHDINEQD